MVAGSYTFYDEEGNYFVITHNVIKEHTFIVFMSGDKKPLMKLWLEHRHLIKGRVFFCCDTGYNYFGKHSIEVEDGLYEYIGKV
jgi:hypothetical protein